MRTCSLVIRLLLGGLLIASPAVAGEVTWFNPVGAKITGSGAIQPGSTPQALRIQHSGGPPLQQGSVTIPLSVRSDMSIDSLYLCYRTLPGDPDNAQIRGITLRTMALPTMTTTLYSDVTTRTSFPGECLGLDVVNVVPFGAPDLVISYSVAPTTHIEIGAIGISSASATIGVVEEAPSAPSLTLSQSRPNPFVRSTRVDFSVSERARVQLRVFDSAGRAVRSLLDRSVAPGQYNEWWDGRDDAGRLLPAGVYFSRLSTNGSSQSERMILLH